MVDQSAATSVASSMQGHRRRPSLLSSLLSFIRHKPLGAIGGFLILTTVIVAVGADYIATGDPYAIRQGVVLKAPGVEGLLGTDQFGRDLFSRIVYGARVSLYVGLGAVIFGTSVGGVIGLLSGYFGGKFDAYVQRVMDMMMTFPSLVLALAIMAMLGRSLNNVVIAIAVTQIPRANRIIRSSALGASQTQYIEAARAIGCTDARVAFFHLLPNCLAPFLIIATGELGAAIVVEASLSFLGLGVPPPEPSWGSMLSGAGRQYAKTAPWMAIFPGLAISLAVFGFNLLGDALRDVWDPRLRGSR